MKTHRRIMAAVICLVLLFGIVPILGEKAGAATLVDLNDESVFLKQTGSDTCTLVANLMMFRRGAIINNNTNWTVFTESTYKSKWFSNGMTWTPTGEGMKGETYTIRKSGDLSGKGAGDFNIGLGDIPSRKQLFIDLLNEHKEGVVAYFWTDKTSGGKTISPHAVLLTDYDKSADVFYCADPNSGADKGRIPLSSSILYGLISKTGYAQGNHSKQDYILGYINQIWIITSGIDYDKMATPNQSVPVPAAPTNLKGVRSGSANVQLNWNAVSGASYYEAQYSRPGVSWTTLDESPANTNSMLAKGFSWNYEYVDFRVRAVNSAGASAWTQVRVQKTVTSTCNWDHSAGGKHDGSYTYKTIQRSDGTYTAVCKNCGAEYVLPTLDTSTAGRYKFKPASESPNDSNVNGIGTEPYKESCKSCGVDGSQVNVVGSLKNAYGNVWYKTDGNEYVYSGYMTKDTLLPPAAPTNLSGVRSGTANVQLGWNDVSDASYYEAQYSRPGVGWTTLDESPAYTNSMLAKGFSWNYEYVDFRVRAVNAAGASAWAEVRVKKGTIESPAPSTPTPTPSGLTSALSCAGIQGVRADQVAYMDTMMNYYIKNDSNLQSTLNDGKSVIFMFEGGSSNYAMPYIKDGGKRNQAIVFVVQKNNDDICIVYSCNNCSSLPDHHLVGGGSPTLPDGTYQVKTIDHYSAYAALHVENVGYGGIDIHSRATNDGSWGWSAGCQLVGSGWKTDNEYNGFMKAVLKPYVDVQGYIWEEYASGSGGQAPSRMKKLSDLNVKSGLSVGYYVLNRYLAKDNLVGDLYTQQQLDTIIEHSVNSTSKANIATNILSSNAPVAPTNLTGVRSGTANVQLNWSAVSGATSYEAQYSRPGVSWTTLDESPVSTNSLLAKGFSWSYDYVDFRVRAVNAAGASEWATVCVEKDSAESHGYGFTTNQMVNLALQQDGKTAADFGFSNDWCAQFVGWCAQQLNITNLLGTGKSYPSDFAEYVLNNKTGNVYYFSDTYSPTKSNIKAYLEKTNVKNLDTNLIESMRDSFVPEAGDLICFLWKSSANQYNWSHIGIVSAVADDMVYYIDGNHSGNTGGTDGWKSSYVNTDQMISKQDKAITCYIRPNYAGADEQPPTPEVVLSSQYLKVNGIQRDVEKYNIDGSNYFMLRDLAYLLNGTRSQFSVGWDNATKTVTILTGAAYTPDGSELVVGTDKSNTAVMSAQNIIVNGVVRDDLSVFNIGGHNFFKLRDLGDTLGFDVEFDPSSNTAVVRSR